MKSKRNGKKANTSQPKPTFHDGLKSKAEAKKALEQRDQIALHSYAEQLKARREQVLALDDFIFEVLARPAVKAMPKPGAAVVRTFITEKGMSLFTATRHFAEFKLVAYSGSANLN
jgi:hypothetical protein